MSVEHVYPAGPGSVPADLTRPTRAYRTHAWLAMGGLALFVLLYLGAGRAGSAGPLTACSRASRTAANRSGRFVAGVCSAFLAVFMWKALVFVKHRHAIDDIEVTATEQPRLFAFINRLADEAGAPRAHHVFLSPRVNAAVFYDLSVLNLLFPSRKNLEIGLGLVNAVTLGELKAVLAHEFGHFAQRSMAVGRWVYIAQQIAGAHHCQARRARCVPARPVALRSAHRVGRLAAVADRVVDPLVDGNRVPRRGAGAARVVARDGAAGRSRGGVAHGQRRARSTRSTS